MPTWYGYEQGPDAHETRPWWRLRGRIREPIPYIDSNGDPGWWEPEMRLYEWAWFTWRVVANYSSAQVCAFQHEAIYRENLRMFKSVEAAMRAIETEQRPKYKVPGPKCGQVWVNGNAEWLVTSVSGGVGWHGMNPVESWPPPGVLVAGPGAPWAPPDWNP